MRYSPDDGTWEHHGPPTTLAHTYGIGQTADGQVWVGGSGLRRFDGERWAIVAEPRGLASWIHGIIPANDGGLWVGTRTYGLFHFGDGEWTRYGVREGLSNNTIRAILQTPDSTVWVATDKGVDRFDGRTWTTHALPGDLQTVKNISSLRRSKDGAIWIGVTGGTIRYYPEEDAPETEIDVHPTKVSQPGNTSFAWSGSDPWRATADEDLEYAWRLDGGDWSAFTRETSRVLLALPGGEHSFEVRARDRDHNADPTPARSVFTVVPPIWRQAWFVGTLTALFVAIAVQSWRVIRRDRALHQSNRFLRQRSEDLEAANRRTKEADRLKSRFLANMSHELRTPLNAILGFAQIMNRDRSSTAEQRERLEIIERNGQHLLTLINDVLDVSKIEAGSATLSRTNFDLFALLDGVEEMFQLRAEAKGLQLTAERADGLPQFVRSDAGKLRQVLINLLGNAVKFTESGSVSVRLGHADSHADSHPACRLLFEVVDTGPGIGPEEAERLFDAFAQTEAGSRAGEGTGLGLAISQEFVQLLGGEIAVHPTAQGTRFTFDIEVEVVARSDVDVKPARRRVMGLEPGQPSFRILVVEDVAENRRLLGELLTPLGFEVREARDGQEGLAEWERWEPHLIWMDMRMPVMDGHEATRRIKATTRGQATVVIALTASAFDEDRAVVLSEGCDAFVRKPFREEEIFDVLATHLGVKFVYDEEPDAPASAAPEALPAQLVESDLAGASPDWRAAVGTAAVRADDEELLRLIAEIAAQNPKLADGLASLVHDFRFDRISALCGGQS